MRVHNCKTHRPSNTKQTFIAASLLVPHHPGKDNPCNRDPVALRGGSSAQINIGTMWQRVFFWRNSSMRLPHLLVPFIQTILPWHTPCRGPSPGAACPLYSAPAALQLGAPLQTARTAYKSAHVWAISVRFWLKMQQSLLLQA